MCLLPLSTAMLVFRLLVPVPFGLLLVEELMLAAGVVRKEVAVAAEAAVEIAPTEVAEQVIGVVAVVVTMMMADLVTAGELPPVPPLLEAAAPAVLALHLPVAAIVVVVSNLHERQEVTQMTGYVLANLFDVP